jgi:hypothetical protein
MKNAYVEDIKNALKSKEYWFGFIFIILSCALTSFFNLPPTGIFGSYKIGSAEFFISATMYRNILLQMSAPVIAIFVCMNRGSIFMCDSDAIGSVWKTRKMNASLLANATIGGSVFLLSFLFLLLSAVIIFPSPTGSISADYGLFKELYPVSPIGYILAYILHSFVCGAVYALFGASLKVLIVKPVNLVLFIPLVFYSCFTRIGWLFPFLNEVISFASPLYTFDIATYDVPLLKRITELAVVLAISFILIVISYKKYAKANKCIPEIKPDIDKVNPA